MALFKSLGKALSLLPAFVAAIGALAKAAPKRVEPRAWNKDHSWQSYRGDARMQVPYCLHCSVIQTRENENAVCPGPPGWRS